MKEEKKTINNEQLKAVETILRFSLSVKLANEVINDLEWLKNEFNKITDKEYENLLPTSYPNIKYNTIINKAKKKETLEQKTVIKIANKNTTKDGYVTYPKKKY